MKLLYLFFTTICVISTATGQDVTVCPGGHMPENCENVLDSCENAVCAHYQEAACRLDPCNNCSNLFYDEQTGTILKCNDEPLLCASCFQNGSPCGGPGGKVEIMQCEKDEICSVFEAVFEIASFNVSIFYRGCIAAHVFEKGGPSCYENEAAEEHLLTIFNGGEVKEGYGCVCTEDICNNDELSNYSNSAEIRSCVDDVGLWYNPGDFKRDVECDVRFCDNTGEFRCIVEEPTYRCEFDEYSYENGEVFSSGTGDCVCNNGDISCTEGVQPELVCYTSPSLTDELNGIEICEEDSVCLVGQVTQPVVFFLTTYVRGCYKKELLEIETGCTTSFEDVQETFPEYHPDDFFSICVCNTSFCNEQQFLEEPRPGGKCLYNGELIHHNYEFNKDECNLCKCNHGEVLCTRHACNGLQCYSCIEDTLNGTLDCGITICQDGELCANFHFQSFGFFASQTVEQGCVTEDEDLPLNECITDRHLIEMTHFVGEGFGDFFFYEGSLLICNEDLCNSRQNFIKTCFPDQVDQASTEAPLKFCVSMDGTEQYMPGDIEIFGCERCTCGGHLNIGMWECDEDLFLCPNPFGVGNEGATGEGVNEGPDMTPPPVKPTEDPSAPYCTFGSDFPTHLLNEHFTSGCGDCICKNGIIRCTEGQCPGLVCVSTRSGPIFCDEGSFCLYQQRISSSASGPISEVKRGCLPVGDWPYNTSTSDNITLFDPIATSGEAFVCTENLCNSVGYYEGFQQCEFNGEYYMHMDEFRPDECNLCVCVNGAISCTSEPCNGPSCSEYVIDIFSTFLGVPPRRKNVTCRFDENCVYAENVTFSDESIIGEASGCLKKIEAPDPGQCTNDTSAIGLFFLDAPMSGFLCTIDTSPTIQTSTDNVETKTQTPTTPDRPTTRRTSTPTTPDRPTTRRTSKGTTRIPPRTSAQETARMPSVPTTTPPTFCSLNSEVGTSITEGRCECTCRKSGTNKKPQVSCKCSWCSLHTPHLLPKHSWSHVIITFKDDFSRVANDVEGFEREVITTLSEALEIPTEAISDIKISEGSIVVEATITSESESTQDELIKMVDEGTFKVTFDGTEFTADSAKIRDDTPNYTTMKPEATRTSPSSGRTVVFVLAGFFFALAVVAIISAACFVCKSKPRAPQFDSLAKNDNHGYDVPPVEYEPNEKGHDGMESLEHGAVSNPYHRSLALQLSEPLPSDTEEGKDHDLSNPYQRSIDAPNDDGSSFMNEAFTTD